VSPSLRDNIFKKIVDFAFNPSDGCPAASHTTLRDTIEDGVIACLILPRVFPEAGLVRHLPWRALHRSNCTERSGLMDLYTGIGDAKISSYPINPVRNIE